MNEELITWMQKHKVCFESSPLYSIRNAMKEQIGFQLNVFAQHNGNSKVDPGSSESYKLYHQLGRIVRDAMPAQENGVCCRFEGFDFSFHLRAATSWKEEVQFVALLVHSENYFHPSDNFQTQCLAEIEQRLANMGAKPGAWR